MNDALDQMRRDRDEARRAYEELSEAAGEVCAELAALIIAGKIAAELPQMDRLLLELTGTTRKEFFETIEPN